MIVAEGVCTICGVRMTRKPEKGAAAAATMDTQDGAGASQQPKAARGAERHTEAGGKAPKTHKQQGKEPPRDMLYYT